VVTNRPAARCRRPFPLSLGLVVALVAAGCSSRPAPDVAGARSAAWRAIRALRNGSPLQARYIEQLVATAEVATAGETAAPWWQPQLGRSSAAWLRATRAARDAVVSSRTVTTTDRRAFVALMEPVRHDVHRAIAESRETGMGRREGAALERAIVCLGTAERFAAVGRWDDATAKLRTARSDASIIHRTWLSLHARFGNATLRQEWRRDARIAIDESRESQSFAIVVDKLRRELILYYRGLRMATFSAELGANGLRRKEHAGDRATPEGLYRVVQLKEGHVTKYHKALLLNYPNEEDLARFSQAMRRGRVPRRAGIGGLIEIHGEGGEGGDWTDGCIALSNRDMDKVYERARVGTPVAIVGTYDG
jgi:L,D-peptidoglycan transpeptidase YkuD (ErfK/YbiS/YcfS/YnhG family)